HGSRFISRRYSATIDLRAQRAKSMAEGDSALGHHRFGLQRGSARLRKAPKIQFPDPCRHEVDEDPNARWHVLPTLVADVVAQIVGSETRQTRDERARSD